MPQEDRHIGRVTVAELEDRLVAQGQRLRELEDREEKQRRELDRLKVAAKTSSAPAPEPVPDNGVPKGCQVLPDSFVVRGSHRVGQMIGGQYVAFSELSEGSENSYGERQRQKTTLHAANQDAFWAEATRDLPPGVWQAPDGMLRTRTGHVYKPAQNSADDEAAKEFERKSQAPGGFAYQQRQALRKD